MHRSCSKRDLETISADEVIPQREYPASCPAPLHYKVPNKREEIGSLTVMSLLEDSIDVAENISQEATPHPYEEEESETESESDDSGGDGGVFDVGD